MLQTLEEDTPVPRGRARNAAPPDSSVDAAWLLFCSLHFWLNCSRENKLCEMQVLVQLNFKGKEDEAWAGVSFLKRLGKRAWPLCAQSRAGWGSVRVAAVCWPPLGVWALLV